MTARAVQRATLYPLRIPMRRKVSHAASERAVADPIVVALELQNGVTGYGETLPRPYVTGETRATALRDIETILLPRVLTIHPSSFTAALEAIDSLPSADDTGRPIPAARAAVELALLDAYARTFHRPIAELTGWLGLGGFGPPGSRARIRFSGVLATTRGAALRKTVRLLRWYGVREFKIKVGDAGDTERLELAWRLLRGRVLRGKASLRVDANGAWTKDEAIDRLSDWRSIPLAGVEQPLAKGQEEDLPVLKDLLDVRLIHDESLVSLDDAAMLHEAGAADGFNIRISKCGGLLPSLKLAGFARRRNILVQLGCMVGETSILSAAGLRFLEMTPGVAFAEGCFGTFLLRNDVVHRPLRFGYGGRPPRLAPEGLGVHVDPLQLQRLCDAAPIAFAF